MKQWKTAASNGYLNIVELMLEKGADDYNEAMTYAAASGHISIVELMLSHGANNFNSSFERSYKQLN